MNPPHLVRPVDWLDTLFLTANLIFTDLEIIKEDMLLKDKNLNKCEKINIMCIVIRNIDGLIKAMNCFK